MSTVIYFQYLGPHEKPSRNRQWIVTVPESWSYQVCTLYVWQMTEGEFYLDNLKADMTRGNITFGREMVKLGEAFARASGLLGEELGIHRALRELGLDDDVEVIMEGTSNEVEKTALAIYKIAANQSFRFLEMVFQ